MLIIWDRSTKHNECLYCKTNDQINNRFTNPLLEAKFVRLRDMLGIQEVAIMGGEHK